MCDISARGLAGGNVGGSRSAAALGIEACGELADKGSSPLAKGAGGGVGGSSDAKAALSTVVCDSDARLGTVATTSAGPCAAGSACPDEGTATALSLSIGKPIDDTPGSEKLGHRIANQTAIMPTEPATTAARATSSNASDSTNSRSGLSVLPAGHTWGLPAPRLLLALSHTQVQALRRGHSRLLPA